MKYITNSVAVYTDFTRTVKFPMCAYKAMWGVVWPFPQVQSSYMHEPTDEEIRQHIKDNWPQIEAQILEENRLKAERADKPFGWVDESKLTPEELAFRKKNLADAEYDRFWKPKLLFIVYVIMVLVLALSFAGGCPPGICGY